MSLLVKLARSPLMPLLLLVAVLRAYLGFNEWKTSVMEPLENELQAKNAQLATVKRESARAEDFKRRKEEKLRELQTVSQQIEATRTRYPTTPNIPQLLKDLADVADRTGIEFHSFKPQPERRQEFVVLTPIDVRLKGTYVQVMSFLDNSANLKRAVVAEKLAIDSPQVRDGSVSLVTATANLVTYSVEDVTTAPGMPPPPGGKGP